MKKIIAILVYFFLVPLSFQAHALTFSQTEKNKEIVREFYQAAINQKDIDAASHYLSDHYIQHNPLVEDGPEGLAKFITFLLKNYPAAHSEIKKIFAEGDYVITHVHSRREPHTRGRAIVDIFKLENSKIVEHWDVIQEIPEQAANSNGMF